ncbi:Histidinol-phosphate aminotransferase [Streptomyces griseomycini]
MRDILAVTARPEVINFAGGCRRPELFDARASPPPTGRCSPRRPRGHCSTPPPRASRRCARARSPQRHRRAGCRTDPDDLLVTTGSQQALSLLATALLEPGDTVLVEDPCYLAALQAFGLAGARVVAVPGDERGLDPEALEDLVVRERPKLLYTVPTFQNPTGRTLPADAPRRRRRDRRRPARRCGSSRTTPTASCATRANGCRGSPPTPAPGTAPCCSAPSPR